MRIIPNALAAHPLESLLAAVLLLSLLMAG
jgi:hypothetical protein